MIGWLQGQRVHNWKQSLKQGVVLSCSGVGYEIQLLPRYLALNCELKELTLWIHHIKREEAESLFGFQTRTERDLFRKLIAVNGVGPQMAMALLEEVQAKELVTAIISADIHTLSKAQGVGKRTAERLSIELRHKLEEFNDLDNEISTLEDKALQELPFKSTLISELHSTLKAIGYEEVEIRRAVREVANEYQSDPNSEIPGSITPIQDFEGVLKASLIWLSNESGQ